MNINEKLYVAGIAVIFITVVIGGVLIWSVMTLWLKNRQEQRKWDALQREKDREDRCERERHQWMQTIREQSERNERMVKQIAEITKEWNRTRADYGRAKELMDKVNLKGLEIKA